MDHDTIVAVTRRWIASVVIGLNLCPFARRVFEAEAIRYVVSDAGGDGALFHDLQRELAALAGSPGVETTLLIHPHALTDFLDYNDFLACADRLLADLGEY